MDGDPGQRMAGTAYVHALVHSTAHTPVAGGTHEGRLFVVSVFKRHRLQARTNRARLFLLPVI